MTRTATKVYRTSFDTFRKRCGWTLLFRARQVCRPQLGSILYASIILGSAINAVLSVFCLLPSPATPQLARLTKR